MGVPPPGFKNTTSITIIGIIKDQECIILNFFGPPRRELNEDTVKRCWVHTTAKNCLQQLEG